MASLPTAQPCQEQQRQVDQELAQEVAIVVVLPIGQWIIIHYWVPIGHWITIQLYNNPTIYQDLRIVRKIFWFGLNLSPDHDDVPQMT